MSYPPNRTKLHYFLRQIKGYSKRQTRQLIEKIEAYYIGLELEPSEYGIDEYMIMNLIHEFKRFDISARNRRGVRVNLSQLGEKYGVSYYEIGRALREFVKTQNKTIADYIGTNRGKYIYVMPKSQYSKFIEFLEDYLNHHRRRGKTYLEYLAENGLLADGGDGTDGKRKRKMGRNIFSTTGKS